MRLADAERWLKRVGATLDGVVAKRRDLPYSSGDRSGMQKIKNYRSADCVVGGFRYNEGRRARRLAAARPLRRGRAAASRRLHLHDQARGQAGAHQKAEGLDRAAGFYGQRAGGPSRWSTERSGEWEPLKPKLVVEVCYDHFSGGRFRHGTRLLRWRPDKTPRQCTLDQVRQKKANLMALLG